jgi:hypothetical protein
VAEVVKQWMQKMASPNEPQDTGAPLTMGGTMTPVEQAAIVLLSIGEEPAAAVLRCLSPRGAAGAHPGDVAHERHQGGFGQDRDAPSSTTTASRAACTAPRAPTSSARWTWRWARRSPTACSTTSTATIRPKMARLQWASPKWLAERIANEHVHAGGVPGLPALGAGRPDDRGPARRGRDLVLLNVARLARSTASCWSSRAGGPLPEWRLAERQRRRHPPGRRDPQPPAGRPRRMVELLRAHDPPWCPRSRSACTTSSSSAARPRPRCSA